MWLCFAAVWAKEKSTRRARCSKPFLTMRSVCCWQQDPTSARDSTMPDWIPFSWRGTITQYVGRLHRLHDGKREVQVYDYADFDVPMLARMFDRRCKGYEAAGYKLHLPASALPGWPPNISLPVDSQWKAQYSSTVRRLVLDGVDPPLANLFVEV